MKEIIKEIPIFFVARYIYNIAIYIGYIWISLHIFKKNTIFVNGTEEENRMKSPVTPRQTTICVHSHVCEFEVHKQ